MFSHNFWFFIFAGVVVGKEFLRECEISRFADFRRLRNFACTVHLFPAFHLPATFRFLCSINVSIFFEPQPLRTFINEY